MKNCIYEPVFGLFLLFNFQIDSALTFSSRLIVGVTHPNNAEVVNVHVRAHNHYMFMLTETKKYILVKKVEIPFGEYMDGAYGEFSVQVEVNDEFVGRILQMGAGLEIVSPQNVREKFKRRVEALADLYKKQK